MFKKMKENQKGFTLVELVVVIAILAVLAALLVPRIMGNVDDAKDQKEITNARTLAGEITVYNAQAKVEDIATMPVYLTSPAEWAGLPPAVKPATLADFPDSTVVQILVDATGNATIDIQ